MEGYSVTEAASVLGVPAERVWELLARGVLSGVPDGETGMRVFLQPRPAPPAVDESPRSNGHGDARQAEAEASPFRELLTEFRGLTERYGQALLALGEARGEVASLRSRVDVLEARMDLRLPFSGPMASGPAWSGPARPTTEPVRRASDQADVEAEGQHEGDRSGRRKRGRPHFTDEFADALARAEDPTPPVLREPAEAGAPPAATHDDHDEAAATETGAADAGLPRELPPAEMMAVIEPEPVAAVEPEPEPTPAAAVEPEAASELEGAPELDGGEQLVAEPDLESEPDSLAESEAAVPPAAEVAAAPEPLLEPATHLEPEQEAEPQPEVEPVPVAAADLAEPEPEAAGEPAAAAEPAAAPEPETAVELEVVHEPEAVDAEAVAAYAAVAALAEADTAVGQPDAILEPDVQPEPEPELAPDAEPGPEPAAGLEQASDMEVDEAIETEPEPPAGTEIELAADDESVPEVIAEAEAEQPPSEPSWDQERYSAQIDEPDWWTPEESLWPEPAVAVAETPVEPEPEPEPEPEVQAEAEADAGVLAADAEDSPPSPFADEAASGGLYRGEETMLWFGRRPEGMSPERTESSGWPSEDAAGEMEVASTGGRGWASPEGGSTAFPGGQELEDALAGLDSIGGQRGQTTGDQTDPPTAMVQPPPWRPPTAAAAPEGQRMEPGELRGPASRAYRRLRRIFPG